jgi:hypothetical protein
MFMIGDTNFAIAPGSPKCLSTFVLLIKRYSNGLYQGMTSSRAEKVTQSQKFLCTAIPEILRGSRRFLLNSFLRLHPGLIRVNSFIRVIRGPLLLSSVSSVVQVFGCGPVALR